MKKWLIERFLPMWAKELVLAENRRLQRENEALQSRIRELNCYIRGLHRGSRYHMKNQGGTQWTS